MKSPPPIAPRPADAGRPGLRRLWNAFRTPVTPEARELVREAWERLDAAAQVPHQTIGRQEEGCGATIGAMPRCDFGCTGCYLGADANSTPAITMEDVKAQLRVLRDRLGPWGNLQITDGEVLLRPIDEVIELLRYARQVELMPMIMTHGEHFRRDPGLLPRLMVEGGLVELSIHIDSTQRGRDAPYRDVRTEAGLMPLRAEFAEIIRAARRTTRRPLRVASTYTVMPENLADVGDVVAWYRANADAFRIVSFQPVAEVGRTRFDGAVSIRTVWEQIARGLTGSVENVETVENEQWWFGHPDCSRLIAGLLLRDGSTRRFASVGMASSPVARRFLETFVQRWGGISFRHGGRLERAAQVAGIVARTPKFALIDAPRFGWDLLHRLSEGHPARLAARLLSGRASLHPFTASSHHFMSADELDTPRGQERLKSCIFTAPIDGELVSMCEINATDVRAEFYASQREPMPLTVGATS